MAKRYLMLGMLVLTLSLWAPVAKAQAYSDQSLEDASAQEIVDGMANKLARGVTNVATGWLEFPKQIVLTTRREGLAKGLTVGPLKGIGMSLTRTFSGAGEAATFFIAYPGFFDPFIEPRYVWQKE